jgi:RNA polymerase sigma-70 factor (ECF subfamily)
MNVEAPVDAVLPSLVIAPPRRQVGAERLTALVQQHWDFVARLLRHLGVEDADVEDAAQQVFLTLQQKLSLVETGKERAFLAACALHIAARSRRQRGRRREVSDEALWELEAREDPERALEQRLRLERLNEVLSAMSEEQRAVFVLYEIEELTLAEIAQALDVPQGTVASRLRRAREIFREALQT